MKGLKHPATIIAGVALFLALGGWATAAGLLISGSQIKNHSIPEIKLTARAINHLKGGTSSAQSTYNTNFVGLPAVTQTLVASLTLTPGSYVLFGKTSISNNVVPENTHCYLLDPSLNAIDDAFTATSTTDGYPEQATVSLEAPLTTSGGTVTFNCLSGAANTQAGDSHLIAIKVASVAGTARHRPTGRLGAAPRG